ncbi:MAG TPA: hypothetical protein VN326_10070 [Casimicrobiaceae bacterium]|nr:hypothetical protein [Casimicrobiaceae bacterium]
MRYLELPMDHYDWNQPEDVEISTVMQSKSFPCILHPGRKAIVKRGNDGTWVYGTFKPDSNDPKPIFISLVEVYCRLHHGYGENDPKLIRGHKSIFALYKARLAVAAGVVQIERRPLPIHLPVALLKRLHSPMEADFAITTTITFGLRLDLAHKYTPGPLAKDGCVLFTSDFRDHWARKKGQARPNEKRREAIFKMLVSYGVLKLIRLPYKTGYAFGPCEFQERHSRKEFRAKTMELFLAEFDKTRKVIGDIEEELDS